MLSTKVLAAPRYKKSRELISQQGFIVFYYKMSNRYLKVVYNLDYLKKMHFKNLQLQNFQLSKKTLQIFFLIKK